MVDPTVWVRESAPIMRNSDTASWCICSGVLDALRKTQSGRYPYMRQDTGKSALRFATAAHYHSPGCTHQEHDEQEGEEATGLRGQVHHVVHDAGLQEHEGRK
jgi:hypothetical protein